MTWEDPSVMDSSGEQVEAEIRTAQIGKGEEAAAGTYTIEYIATDSAGNTAMCQIVIVVTGKIDTSPNYKFDFNLGQLLTFSQESFWYFRSVLECYFFLLRWMIPPNGRSTRKD